MGTLLRESELRERLMQTSDQFRRLAAEHKSYDNQLDKLSSRAFLSEEEKLQETLLKKKKLLLKDQMYSMVQKYRRELGEDS